MYVAMINCGVEFVSVHIVVEEKLVLTAGRDGGLQNMEIHGIMKLRVADDRMGRVKVCVNNNDNKGIQIQVGLSVWGWEYFILRLVFFCCCLGVLLYIIREIVCGNKGGQGNWLTFLSQGVVMIRPVLVLFCVQTFESTWETRRSVHWLCKMLLCHFEPGL